MSEHSSANASMTNLVGAASEIAHDMGEPSSQQPIDSSDAATDPNNEDDAQEWERHVALHEHDGSANPHERTKERLFEQVHFNTDLWLAHGSAGGIAAVGKRRVRLGVLHGLVLLGPNARERL